MKVFSKNLIKESPYPNPELLSSSYFDTTTTKWDILHYQTVETEHIYHPTPRTNIVPILILVGSEMLTWMDT